MKMDITKSVVLFQLVVAFLVTLATRSSAGVKSLLPHKCIHDEIAAKYPRTSIPHFSRSYSGERVRDRRQAGGYLPFRVVVYFVTENITNSPTVLPKLNDPSGPFQLAINYFQSVFSVVRAPHNLVIPPYCASTNNGQCTSVRPRMCGDFITIPDEHLGTVMLCDPICREVGGSNIGVDADYIFYIVSVDDDFCRRVGTAYANSCFFDDVTNRPLTGFTNICPAAFRRSRQSFFNLVVHEMFHAVGFSGYLFGFFIDENGNQYNGSTTLRINGIDVLAINSPKVLSYGREYYSCPDLQGVLLENEGGPFSYGSHWESRTLANEVMSVSLHEDFTSISNFTLLLLEDSGWYKVNYGVAESLHNYELLWGKGLGCSFITAGCDTWPYSCSPGVSGCSYDYQASSVCVTSGSDFLLDGCSYFTPYSNGVCNSLGVPVTNSCFPLMFSDGTLTGRCYSHQCYRYLDLQKLFYTVTRSGSTKLCPSDGAMLTFSDGTMLTCPPVELTCSRRTPIFLLSSTTHIPSSWCHDSCATCSRPASPAHCLTCSAPLTLRGTAPSVCTTDNCRGGEFQDSSGNCVACAAGCRACTGPNNADCLACEDETLYRLTTNQLSRSACVIVTACDNTSVSAFGDRTCSTLQRGGGASSIHYHQFPLLLLLVVCSLCL